jgi:hypothetical protein
VAAYVTTAAIFLLPTFAWLAAGQQLSERAAGWIAFVSPLVVALNELPGGWEPVRDLYAAHRCVMGGACLAMLAASWVWLNVLLRQG